MKDRVPLEKQNYLVYQILCSDCGIPYARETKQRFQNRLIDFEKSYLFWKSDWLQNRSNQHKSAVQRGDQNHSEISQHCLELGQLFRVAIGWDESRDSF